ncbi:PREDICTED: F-box/kelch-repeat protein At2g29830-like [Camelina sativa]|uniref:F-box/kelch-repeat protein At2g29830-like n=1 Tax=Camelina sativa TaxID=90675 RepID=A0ABM0WP35_CAMSA|nr:PREDICTED: F-box/kelch-repeat protein At2g29830-like [Camelina sativa]
MVVISELSGGSNGGDPYKNPQEEEEEVNQNENPQEVVEVNLAPVTQELPKGVMEIIVARVPICYYLKLTHVCRAFRQLIASQQLFLTRLRHGVTESVLYALISLPALDTRRWFILHRSNMSSRFIRIYSSFPPTFPGSAAVTIGHKIYVVGGYVGFLQPLTDAIVIDCRFNTWRYLPNMQRARFYAAAGVIDGKIYVIGGRKKQDDDWIEVFDVELEIWETVPSQCPNDASASGIFGTSVVMQGRIFILDHLSCLAYEPRQGLWQSWGLESQLKRLWRPFSCAVRDLLYCLDLTLSLGHPIVVYYPNELVWRPLMGVSTSQLPMHSYDHWSKMVNFGGKLLILGGYHGRVHDVCCVEIALETRQGGQIWGNVESTSLVYTDDLHSACIEICLTVTVKFEQLVDTREQVEMKMNTVI